MTLEALQDLSHIQNQQCWWFECCKVVILNNTLVPCDKYKSHQSKTYKISILLRGPNCSEQNIIMSSNRPFLGLSLCHRNKKGPFRTTNAKTGSVTLSKKFIGNNWWGQCTLEVISLFYPTKCCCENWNFIGKPSSSKTTFSDRVQ